MKKITESEQIPEFQESLQNMSEEIKQRADSKLKAITEMCTLSDIELMEECEKWIDKLCKSGGDAWTLEVPVNMNRDPDMLFTELIRRFSKHFKITDVLRDRSPKPAGAVWVKGDYDQLYEQLKADPEKRIACYVDYDYWISDIRYTCRDICSIDGEMMEFQSRGHGYGSVRFMPGDEKENFIGLCTEMNVEWLYESGTASNKDAIDPEELWDKHSECIDDGKIIMTKDEFQKTLATIKK